MEEKSLVKDVNLVSGPDPDKVVPSEAPVSIDPVKLPIYDIAVTPGLIVGICGVFNGTQFMMNRRLRVVKIHNGKITLKSLGPIDFREEGENVD